MKKSFILFAGLSAALGACNSDQDVNPSMPKGQAVSFVVNDAVSRTATSASGATSFLEGDRIGIFATGGATGENVLHYVGAEGNITAETGQGVYADGSGKPASFYAYYPYSAEATASQVTFAVAEDQSTDEAFNGSDFLTAVVANQTVEKGKPVQLKFNHRLAMVQVEFSELTGNEITSVALNGCVGSIDWNMASNTVTATGETMAITMHRTNEPTLIYRAMVPAQTIAGGTKLLAINIDGQEYVLNTAAPLALAEGSVKRYRIGIAANGHLVDFNSDLTISDWTQEDIIDEEVKPAAPAAILEATSFANLSFTDLNKNKEEITAAGWYRFNRNEGEIVEIATDTDSNASMHFKRTLSSWHDGTFYYCAENVAAGKYQIKLKAKSSQVENMKSNQMRMGAYMQLFDEDSNKTVDYFAIIDKSGTDVTTVYPQIVTYEDYAEYTLDIDLSRVSTIHHANATNVTDESKSAATPQMLKKVVFYFTVNNTTGIDFWVRDISILPLL